MDNYAGFWIRLGAYLIDLVIIVAASAALMAVFGLSFIEESLDPDFTILDLFSTIAGIAYFAGFEASNMQGTPGKRALGLVVTDIDGNRISLLRAIG